MYIQSLSSHRNNSRVWHHAAGDGSGGKVPLCNHGQMGSDIVLINKLPPKHRLCRKCQSIQAGGGERLILYLWIARKETHHVQSR